MRHPLFLLILVIFCASACTTQRPPVPVGVIPPAQPLTSAEEEYGHKVLAGLTEKWQLDYNHPRYQSVLDIVDRITKAIKADSDPWHVYVLKDDSFKNAAATRGNHVFIWTGMIDATQDEDELAAVLAHEIGHVLARHTDPDPNEELRKIIIGVGAMAAGIAAANAIGSPNMAQQIGRLTSEVSQEIGNALAVYPYSRERELEADKIGIFLMAKAKYNPEAALRFWQKAQQDPTFYNSLAFLSTHPPAEERLNELQQIYPLAREKYLGLSSSAANSNTPLSGGDSFDVSGLPPPQPTPETTWRVNKNGTLLYREAREESKPLGEFVQGYLVSGVEEKRGWVRIVRPDQGYLKVKDLQREGSS